MKAPPGIVTEWEPITSATPGLSLLRVIWMPPTGAGPSRVTVPVELCEPTTREGLNVNPLTPGDLTIKVADFEVGANVAFIVTTVVDEIAFEKIKKEYWVSPGVMVTEAGIETTPAGVAVKLTTVPAGACVLRVMVPFEIAPPKMLEGEIVRAVIAGGLTVNDLLDFTDWDPVALIVTMRCTGVRFVRIGKLKVVSPAGITIVDGLM